MANTLLHRMVAYLKNTNMALGLLRFLFLFGPLTSFSQTITETAYGIVPEVIRQDTVPDPMLAEVLHDLILKGRFTEQDSIDQVEKRKERSFILLNWAVNTEAERSLAKAYLDTSKIAEHFGRERIMEFFDRIGPDRPHPDFLGGTGVTIVERVAKQMHNHRFSEPLHVTENQFLVYHEKYWGSFAQLQEWVLYRVMQEGVVVEQYFEVWDREQQGIICFPHR
ncbi:hypothetical protein [Maribacter sp. 2-571]|uniref:hypothetical protein n=1 Tax=Maribacter sp. 2-571 TaxID=3417569 RepID=UPI003D348939